MKMIGAEVVLETVKMIENGDYTFIRQKDELASHAPKIFHETCRIDFNNPIQKIHNFIRGLSPYPGAWIQIDDKEMKILSATKEKLPTF